MLGLILKVYLWINAYTLNTILTVWPVILLRSGLVMHLSTDQIENIKKFLISKVDLI